MRQYSVILDKYTNQKEVDALIQSYADQTLAQEYPTQKYANEKKYTVTPMIFHCRSCQNRYRWS